MAVRYSEAVNHFAKQKHMSSRVGTVKSSTIKNKIACHPEAQRGSAFYHAGAKVNREENPTSALSSRFGAATPRRHATQIDLPENQNKISSEIQNSDNILTKDQVASMLKKSRRTIELWTRAGYLSSIKIRHSVFFEREQLLKDIRRFSSGRQ